MKILEEFWYGNIEPTEYDTSSCKEYKKLLDGTVNHFTAYYVTILKIALKSDRQGISIPYITAFLHFQIITKPLVQ